MKNILLFTIIFCLILSCKSKEDKTWTDLKKSTDHTKYISFLLNNTNSKHFEKALDKYFYYKDKYVKMNMPPPTECFSSCGSILINQNGKIFFEDDNIDMDTLQGHLIRFIKNEKKLPGLPTNYILTDSQNVERKVSRASFEIIYHESQIKKLKDLLHVISNSLDEYSKYLSNYWFNKEFEDLNSENQKFIDYVMKSKVRIQKSESLKVKIPPPPPKEINVE